MFRSLTLAALVAYASAQSISDSCTTALAGIAANPDAAACLSPGSLVSLFTLDQNSTVIPPINNWLTSVCAAPACSNATIDAVVKNVTSGCSSDLSPLGFNSDSAASITSLIQQYYPTARKVLCLKDGDTNCITKTLTNIQNMIGTLSLSSLTSGAIGFKDDLPANLTCTNCVKAAYNVIKTDVPAVVSDADSSLQEQCGASFTDGQTPSGITQSASNLNAGNAGNKGGAMSLKNAFVGLGAAGVVVSSTIFTFFI